MKIEVKHKPRNRWERGMSRKSYEAKTRVYVFISGENVLENLENRFARPHLQYRNEIIPEVIKQIPELEGKKLVWSQKAGCRCGCSPAFIVQDMFRSDIFVNVSAADSIEAEALKVSSLEDKRDILGNIF